MGDAFLTPGWTSYNKRLQYQVYDVTNSLKKREKCNWREYRQRMVQNEPGLE